MIYIVKHIPYVNVELPNYVDIGVGKMFRHKGDNINYLNPYLNEMTALYDIWKNVDDDIVGMIHYRREFDYRGQTLTFTKAINVLKKYEIITTLDFIPPVTPYENLLRDVDTHTLDKYLSQLPQEVQEWFNHSNSFNTGNMFVCRKELIDKFCEWYFPMIIPMAEQFMREDSNENFNHNRALGFISERIFGYWCKDLNRYKLNFRMI